MRLIPLLLLSLFATAASAADVPITAGNCQVYAPADAGKTAHWSGPCKDGFADGEGTLQWSLKGKPDLSYKGAMKSGRYHGVGYTMAANNTQYEGEFVDGLAHGFGIWVNPFGDRYDGEWQNGRREGKGKMVYVAGGEYDGGWRNGVYHGKGTITYSGGRRASYDFDNGSWPDEIVAPAPDKLLSVKRDPSGSIFAFDKLATNLVVPGQLTYAQLSPEQKKALAASYPLIHPADEPPYPVSGQRNVLEKLARVQDEDGSLLVLVKVGADGRSKEVTTVGQVSKETRKYVHYVFSKEKYKPGKCDGQACDMMFAYRFSFKRPD